MGKASYVTEVAPPRPASDGKPATGPEYRCELRCLRGHLHVSTCANRCGLDRRQNHPPPASPSFPRLISTSITQTLHFTPCRAVIAKDGPPTLEGVATLYELFSQSVQRYPNNNCLGKRSSSGGYEWLTYQQTEERAAAIASAMAKVGVPPRGRAGVYGANSPEWMISMQACNRMSIYCVPLYDSLGEHAIEYIINHSGEGQERNKAANLACHRHDFKNFGRPRPRQKAAPGSAFSCFTSLLPSLSSYSARRDYHCVHPV